MKSELNEKTEAPVSISTLPTELIQEMVDNYRKNQLSYINENMAMNDAHSVWFDIPTLKNFIAEIESEAQKIDPQVQDSELGIRFYYASYSENPPSTISADYAKMHTIIMIPTKKQNDLNYDFNPFGEEEALASRPSLALAQNHGCLVPPDTTQVESY